MNIINDVLVDKLFKDPPKRTKEIPLLSEKTASGDGMVVINDAYSDFPITNLTLRGKSEQLTTTGKNLFDVTKVMDSKRYEPSSYGYIGFPINVEPGKTYTFNRNKKNGYGLGTKYKCGFKTDINGTIDNWLINNENEVLNFEKKTIVAKTNKIYFCTLETVTDEELSTIIKTCFLNPQLELGNIETTYEPYTGGKPSPSPDYPQEIKNVGKWNEEKQKYEVNIRITNAKESWDKEQTITLTSDRPITKWDKLVEQDGQIGWLFNRKIDVMPKTGWVLHPNGYFYNGNVFNDSAINLVPMDENNLFTHFKLGNPSSIKDKSVAWLYVHTVGKTTLRIRIADETINTVEALEKYIADKDMKIMYELAVPEFVQLPQSEQDAIRALLTYYPTTVITADGGELPVGIEVTYMHPEYIPTKQSALRMWFKENPII